MKLFFNSNPMFHIGLQYARNRISLPEWWDDQNRPTKLIFTMDTELNPSWKVPRKMPRLKESISAVLSLLEDFKIKGTFLCEGQMIETYPEMVKKISEAGHEIGYHGYAHESYGGHWKTQTIEQPKILTKDRIGTYLREGKNLIYGATGQEATSFVAPFHLASFYTLDELQKNGFTADASVYNHCFGLPSKPFMIGELVEIPFAVPKKLNWRYNQPVLDYAASPGHLNDAIKQCKEMSHILLTCHPWEMTSERLHIIDYFLSGLEFIPLTMREIAASMLTNPLTV
jgi:peptidoglycan/xylan/chitin deacetylase (PgdA/CDA1 family)